MRTVFPDALATSVDEQRRRAALMGWSVYLLGLLTIVGVGAVAVLSAPKLLSVAVGLLVVAMIATAARPTIGVYVICLFTFVGDTITVPTYPFVKDFSSRESLFYLGRGLIASPLELMLVFTALAALIHVLGSGHRTFVRGRLLLPLVVFTGFVVFGLLHGLGSGGSTNAGLWEARSIFYVLAVYVLATNVLSTVRQYSIALSLVMLGLLAKAGFALHTYWSMTALQRQTSESLGDHAAALYFDLLFIVLIGGWLYRGSATGRRALLTLAAPLVLITYLVSQRRAAVVALIVGMLITLGALRMVNRRTFRRLLPVLLVVGLGYVAAFWNSQGSLGFPARAVKTVVAPSRLSARDQSSDIYRQLEVVDILVTIRSSPVTGIGFGQKFFRPVALPDISFFVWWEYMTHNSILWMWMKTGIGGFIAMLYVFAAGLRSGALALRKVRGELGVLTLGATAYIAMYAVYAYVDIGWDPQSMVLLGLALAIAGNAERLLDGAATPADAVAAEPESDPASVRIGALT
jgi:hypothetical protein